MDLGRDAQVTAHAGLPLVVEALRALRLDEVIERVLHVAKRRRGYSELEKLEALTLLLAAGGDRVEDIRVLSHDKGLMRLLDRMLPSPDALLDFLGGFDAPAASAQRPVDELSWVPPETAPLQALGSVNDALIARGADRSVTTATIDHDGTIIESHKQAATVAYEGTRGYQPLVAVWAEQDLIVADEFRDGNVPGGKDPLSSVKRAFEALPPWVRKRYFRADSAAYYTPLLKYLVAQGIEFSISADMGQELRACCTAVPESRWTLLEARERESVHLAEVEFSPGDWSKDAQPLRYVAMRFTARQQDLFDGPKYLAVVTNRRHKSLGARRLVRWHWAKAGTIEHIHRSLKDELGAGVLPSNRFGANAAWFRINALTHNLLTLLRRRALPDRFRDTRPKRLRFEVLTVPGRLVVHQRQLTVELAAGLERTEELIEARWRLLCMRRALAASTRRRKKTRPPKKRSGPIQSKGP
jgi:hypothetical protein